jgi:hypothetical protein
MFDSNLVKTTANRESEGAINTDKRNGLMPD